MGVNMMTRLYSQATQADSRSSNASVPVKRIKGARPLLLAGALGFGCALNLYADVPASPVLLDPAGGAPVSSETTGADPLRRYLRGNPTHGWQRGQMGKPTEFWNTRVDQAPVAPSSRAVTQYMSNVSRGDRSDASTEFFAQFDLGQSIRNEPYSNNVHEVDETTPLYEWRPRLSEDGFSQNEFFNPHCDRIRMPVVPNGRLQSETNYECSRNGDCHLYAVNSTTGQVFEQWRAHNPGPDINSYSAGCTNVWELSELQPPELRGLSCTSANAAGIPYVPLLITPGEIKEGVIRHAVAFTTLNAWVRRDEYVRPATHNPVNARGFGAPESAPGEAMLYGSRFRLNADFEIDSSWPPALRVVLQALKEYGMIHIDGGPRMIIASNDAFSEHNWSDPDIRMNPFDLTGIARLSWEDFELVSDTTQVGSMVETSCSREPINEF